MQKKPISRRQLVKYTGSGSLLVSQLASQLLRAESGSPSVNKFIYFFTANGTTLSQWLPRSGSASPGSLQLGHILEPLNAFKSKITLLQGVDVKIEGPGDPHHKGTLSALTAAENLSVNGGTGYNSGQSIDQFISQYYKSRSIVAGCQSGSGNLAHISSMGSNKPVTPDSDPYRLYAEIFSEFAGTPDEIELQKKIKMKLSVLDFNQEELKGLRQKLPRKLQSLLDQHTDKIRVLESQLANSTKDLCEAPQLAKKNIYGYENLPNVIDLQTLNIVYGLKCGLANTGVITVGWGGDDHTHSYLGVYDNHHSVAHEAGDQARNSITKINRYYATKFAELLSLLDSIPDGNGTMLDSTVVVWGNELSDGYAHNSQDIPYVIAGANQKVPGGRYLRYNRTSHGELLVSIANALGINISSFNTGKRALPGLVV